jgi:hypothetical protein
MDQTQGNPPEEKKEETPQPTPQETKPEETKPQEATPHPQETPEAQQPHLIETESKEEKKSFFAEHKSFILALIIIVITIIAGIALALNLGKLTQRGPKEEEVTPVITPQPTRPPAIPTIIETSPSAQEATPSSKFEELLKEQEEATPSQEASGQAQPTQ